jgi:hypothetical protein
MLCSQYFPFNSVFHYINVVRTVNRLSMTQLASECPVSFEKLLSPFGYFLQGTFISNSTYVGLVNGADITGLGLFIARVKWVSNVAQRGYRVGHIQGLAVRWL